jgi:hypothetical protein
MSDPHVTEQPKARPAVACSDLLAAIDALHHQAETNKEMDLKCKRYAQVYGWECHMGALLRVREAVCEMTIKQALAANEKS